MLTLITGEPADKTLDFYRKELGARGWSLWSEKTNGKQTADGPSGTVHERGAYAHYVSEKDPAVALVLTLQTAEAGKSKVELKTWPIGILASAHESYLKGGTNTAKPVDVSALPRVDGAKVDDAKATPNRLAYMVQAPAANTIPAVKALLVADGWKSYVAPLEEPRRLSLTMKKGGQGLSVSFTTPAGGEQTGVEYSSTRLPFALPVPDDAADIVLDENRPYLGLVTSGTPELIAEFYQKALAASGWKKLSAADAVAKWPGAKLEERAGNATLAYYISENQRPAVLSIQPRDDGKLNVEMKVPSFALPQSLEPGDDIFGLPRPKLTKSAGGTGGTNREMHAHVPADLATVLAFYRRELSARNWKEETQGAAVNPGDVTLTFSPPEGGSATLRLGYKHDLTVVSLERQMPAPVAKADPVPSGNSIDTLMKQAEQLVRDADAMTKSAAPKMPQEAAAPAEALRPLANNNAPVPLPETAEGIDFGNGRLEFRSASSVRSVADFYRSAMKQQGWNPQTSVINNDNMVVLNYAKAGKSVTFTIMKMGPKTNVSADGSALSVVAAKPAAPSTAPAAKSAAADTPSQPATADDLVAEETGGLPVPKRRTQSEGAKSQFRRQLNASIPLDLSAVLGFYRRELGKLNWKEEQAGAVVAADNAKIAFSTPEGPAMLTLGRKDGATTVELVAKNPAAAAKAGIVAKPGQVKLLVSNMTETEAVITINKQAIRVPAGAGMKGPDGPMVDAAPGKQKFSVKVAGKPAAEDEVTVGANETWGLLIGPGGVLPLHVY